MFHIHLYITNIFLQWATKDIAPEIIIRLLIKMLVFFFFLVSWYVTLGEGARYSIL